MRHLTDSDIKFGVKKSTKPAFLVDLNSSALMSPVILINGSFNEPSVGSASKMVVRDS
jgi:hypothetical protein